MLKTPSGSISLILGYDANASSNLWTLKCTKKFNHFIIIHRQQFVDVRSVKTEIETQKTVV